MAWDVECHWVREQESWFLKNENSLYAMWYVYAFALFLGRKTFNMLCAFSVNLLLLKPLYYSWIEHCLLQRYKFTCMQKRLVFMYVFHVLMYNILWCWSRMSGKFLREKGYRNFRDAFDAPIIAWYSYQNTTTVKHITES